MTTIFKLIRFSAFLFFRIFTTPIEKRIIINLTTMKNIAVIGSGTMGNGIAHTFAQFGYNVSLIDISQPALDKALATIAKNLDRIVAKGTITEADKAQTLKNITTLYSNG